MTFIEASLPRGDRDDDQTSATPGPPSPGVAEHDCDGTGWAGEDAQGRPIVCVVCKPHLGIGRACLGCGAVVHGGASRCPACNAETVRAVDRRRGTTAQRGYGSRWQRLSRQARKLQDWCSDCGSRVDLTVDHSEEAWERYERGLPLRLADVDVVCRPCNARRGAARGPNVRHPLGEGPGAPAPMSHHPAHGARTLSCPWTCREGRSEA